MRKTYKGLPKTVNLSLQDLATLIGGAVATAELTDSVPVPGPEVLPYPNVVPTYSGPSRNTGSGEMDHF